MIKIVSVHYESPADSEGIRAGDELISINGNKVGDILDVMYHSADDEAVYLIRRGSTFHETTFYAGEETGLEYEDMGCMACGNKCVFCFIDQNPEGMRPTIYIKDEDYRYSFLYGSYVTLTTLGDRHIERIIEQHLSPLYVSVHATDTDIRKKLLGIRRDDRLLEKIDRITSGGIDLHCQVVVCPGINDGDVLKRTLHDLYLRWPSILSCAVVPVGLTRHREGLKKLTPVDTESAAAILETVETFSRECRETTGYGFAYCADELYIRCGWPIPDATWYDDFPQIENGVGMVRDFLDASKTLERRVTSLSGTQGDYLLVTGMSMAPFIEEFAGRLTGINGFTATSLPVENRFYGPTVTVSGLLTGSDIIDALKARHNDETIVIPPNCLNTDGVFLDNTSPRDIEKMFGVPVIQAEYDPVAIFEDRNKT